jgi:nicotinamidase-related amidase
MAYARWSRTPVLTCIDTHRPHDIGDNYVMAAGRGSPLERMLSGTLLPRHRLVECDNCLSISLEVLDQTQQAIFTKVHKDPFTNPKFDRLMTEMPTRRFVVFGVPLESTIRLLVLGLIMRGRRVLVIEDACGFFRDAEASMTLRQLCVKGAELQTSDEYVRESMAQLTQRRVRRRRRDVA